MHTATAATLSMQEQQPFYKPIIISPASRESVTGVDRKGSFTGNKEPGFMRVKDKFKVGLNRKMDDD